MAVPKRKISKRRRNIRRANDHVIPLQLVKCPNCDELKRPHTVCSNCGMYDSKEIIKDAE